MHFSWHWAAWAALDALGVLACIGGIDCVAVGLRELRRGDTAFARRTGLLTAATGAALLLIGGLLFWAGIAVRNR